MNRQCAWPLFTFPLALVLVLALLSSCSEKPSPPPVSFATPPSTNLQTFQAKGVILGLHPGGKIVDIRHETIPDFMPAMTMPFDVKDPQELTGLHTNDTVTFRLSVTDTDSWIDHIQKLEAPSLTELPVTNGLHFVRDADPLQIGDPLPEYHFTNQLGQPISTTQFKGQALAISFIFTRCPLPNFCPRMSSNLEEAQSRLLADKTGATNWQLITISFDPEFDTPVVLQSYSELHHADPTHWSFLTGNISDVAAISEQFGQTFWKDQAGAINHNLRTIVVNSSGRIHQIFQGNKWTSDELVIEMLKAAQAGSK